MTARAATVAPHLRRARLGVALMFITNGLIWANLAPRYPEIRRAVDLSYGQFGTALMFTGIGAMVVGLSAAALIRRFTSAGTATVAMVLQSLGAVAASLAPNGWLLAAALFFLGAVDSIADVAQNAHGLRVQRGYGRSIFNSFHGMWSVGSAVGGLMGGAAAGLAIPVTLHLGVVAGLVVVLTVTAYRLALRGPDVATDDAQGADEPGAAAPRPRVPMRTWAVLGALALIAIAGGWVEDAAGSWSTSYLRDELGAGAAVASWGFVAFMLMHFLARLVGDRLVDRYGDRNVARVSGGVTAVGMGLTLAFPSIPGTIAGFAVAGLGVAMIVPAAMNAADQLPGFKHGTGLTILSWTLRVAFLLSPPLVGAIADATSLRVGLALVPVAGVVIALLAFVLAGPQTPRADVVEDPSTHLTPPSAPL